MLNQICYVCVGITWEEHSRDCHGMLFTQDMKKCSHCKKTSSSSNFYLGRNPSKEAKEIIKELDMKNTLTSLKSKPKDKILTQETFFHEEAHIYFGTKEDHDKFAASYIKNPEWAIRYKSKWNPVTSITQILGKAFPFNGGDLKITKAWFAKEALFQGAEEQWTEDMILMMNKVEEYLKESVERSKVEGNVGHETIQEFIEHFIKTKETNKVKSDNNYFMAFIKALMDKELKLGAFVKNIDTILPSEIPIVGNLSDEFKYAGKWDLLVQDKAMNIHLIDIKTGSPLISDKSKKVGLQLQAYAELVEQSLGKEVDFLTCWELSYTIPYKELLKQLKAENKKVNKDEEKIRTLQSKIETIEANGTKGLRKYYFKEHNYNKGDDFKELAINVLEREKVFSNMKKKGKK